MLYGEGELIWLGFVGRATTPALNVMAGGPGYVEKASIFH